LGKLDEYFADPHEEQRAKETIANMRQGSNRAETFFAKFEMAQMEAGYDNIFHEDYMVNLLYKALNYKIVERIFLSTHYQHPLTIGNTMPSRLIRTCICSEILRHPTIDQDQQSRIGIHNPSTTTMIRQNQHHERRHMEVKDNQWW
jgi:hypothetical protein